MTSDENPGTTELPSTAPEGAPAETLDGAPAETPDGVAAEAPEGAAAEAVDGVRAESPDGAEGVAAEAVDAAPAESPDGVAAEAPEGARAESPDGGVDDAPEESLDDAMVESIEEVSAPEAAAPPPVPPPVPAVDAGAARPAAPPPDPASPPPPVPGSDGASTPPPVPAEAAGDGEAEIAETLEADEDEQGFSLFDTAVREGRADEPIEYAALLLRELDGEEEKERQAVLMHEVGVVQELRLDDEGEALKSYAKALQIDPTLRVNVWAIRRIFWGRELWPNLLKLLDVETRFTEGDHERAELCLEKGQILEDKVGDVAGAREAYRKALEHEEGHLGALLALERLATREGDAAALADEVLPALARATPDPARRVAILLDLARLRETLDGGYDRVLAVLEDAYAVGAERERVLREFARVAEASERREEMLRVWTRRLELLAAVPPADPAARAAEVAAMRRRQAQICRDAGDFEAAFGYLSQALEALPDDPLLLREAVALATRLGRPGDAAPLLGRLHATLPADDPQVIGLRYQRALALDAAGEGEAAAAELAEITAAQPAYFPWLAREQHQAARAGDDARLAELFGREADALRSGGAGLPPLPEGGDPAWLAAVEVARGELLERLGRDDDAVAAFRAALAARPHDRAAVDALEAHFTRTGRFAELTELLEGELPEAGTARLDYLLETLARLHGDRLGDPAKALEYLRRLVDAHPGDYRALRRLQHGLAACERWAEVVELNAHLAAEAGPGPVAAALNLDSAHLCDLELGDAGRAVELLGRVLEAVPGDPLAGAMLEQILRRERRFEELIEMLRREVDATLSQDRITALLFKIGVIYERELGRPEEAAGVYRDIVDRAPGYAPAVRALAEAHRIAGDLERLGQALETEVELLAAAEDQATALVRLGELYEVRLKRDDLAEDAYSRALLRTPTTLAAALGLLRVYARRRDPARFTGVCEQAAEMVGDDASRAAFLEEAAHLAGRPDGDPLLAAELWARVRALQPVRLGPLFAAGRNAARAAQPAELAGAYEGLARALGPGALGAAYATRAATLTEVATPDDRAAIAGRYLEAVGLAPGLADPLVPLADAITGAGPEVADVLMRRMALADGPSRLQLMLERAEVLEERGHLKAAAVELAGVLAAAPDHLAAVEAVRRVAARGGDLQGVALASARLGVLLREPGRKAQAFRDAARILDGELGRAAEAAPLWRQVLEHAPEDDEAYGRLHHILVEAKDLPGLEDVLSHRVRNVLDGDGRIPYLWERAELRLRRRGDRVGAGRDLKQILDINPEHQGALRLLGQLLAEDGGHRQALDLFDRFLALTDDPAQTLAVLLEIAQVQETGLGDSDEAIETLERAIDLAPGEPFAYERLANLYLARGDHARAVEALAQLGKTRDDPAFRARVEIRAAEIYRTRLHDLEEAARALLRARQLDPLSLDAIAALLEIFGEQRNASARKLLLDQALAEVRDSLAPNPLKIGRYEHLARLFEWAGDTDGRVFAAQAQAYFNAASPENVELLAHLGPRPFAPVREVAPDAWRNRLSHPRGRGLPVNVWLTIANAARQLHPQDLAAFNVGKGDRVNLKSAAAEWPTVDRIARTFGVSGFELYVSRAQPDLVAAVASDPPALVVGRDLAGTPGPRLRFRLGRALALLRDRTMPVLAITPEELAVLFAAAARTGGSEVAFSVPAALVEERTRQLGKLMAKAEKKALAVLASRIGRELEQPRTFRTGVEITAARAGLLAAGDLEVALDELAGGTESAEARRGRSTEELVARFGTAPDRLDLLSFAISADHLALRGETGLKVS